MMTILGHLWQTIVIIIILRYQPEQLFKLTFLRNSSAYEIPYPTVLVHNLHFNLQFKPIYSSSSSV